jgi:hypothetical protein
MKSLNENGVPQHLDDPDLISYLDGEMLRADQEEARAHLESCWNCRSGLLAMQNSIEKFLQLRKEIAPADLPPSNAAVAQFRGRLSLHSATPVSLRMPFKMRLANWRRLFPDFSQLLKYKKTAIASAVAMVFLFITLVDPFDWTMASADVLLARAETYEFLHEKSTGKVVRSRVRLDRIDVSGSNERNLGQIETVADNLSSAIHISAQDTPGRSRQKSLVNREQLSWDHFWANPFTNEFGPQLTTYFSAQTWFPDVSVTGYRKLIEGRGVSGSEGVVATDRGTSYEVHHAFAPGHTSGITETVLVLDANTYAPEQVSIFTLGSGGDGERVEYRLTRTSFELVERTPEVAQLFRDSRPEGMATPGAASPEIAAGSVPTSPRLPVSPSPVVASAELEIEVLRLLNQAGADLGEQVSVTHTPEGTLRVEGVVETDKRKKEILAALAPVNTNPAIRIEVQTVDEALARQTKNQPSSSPALIGSSTGTANTIPVDEELRRYFAGQGLSGAQIDEEERLFASRTLGRSLRAIQHAWAIKRLTGRFSEDQLRNLDPEARANWLTMIRSHAQGIKQELAMLRQGLSPIFPMPDVSHTQGQIDTSDNKALSIAAERLLALCSENDTVLRSALTISSDTSRASSIKASQFWRSLSDAQSLAASLGEQ